MRKKRKDEERLQVAVSRYLKLKYPDVIFTSEASGLKVGMGTAVQMAKQRNPKRGLPDMIILEPRGQYYGLMIELKRDVKEVFLKDGSLSKKQHIQEQSEVLNRLHDKRYYATFAVGLDSAISIIDNYMQGNL